MINETTHVFIMARGKGTRLHPLTQDTCKPNVFFGGQYRIIDFVLSNLAQANLQNITVLIPNESSDLRFHLQQHWPHVQTNSTTATETLIGNASSVLRALQSNLDNRATHIGIFPSDQVFHFSLRSTLLEHHLSGAKASILTRWLPSDTVTNFGVLHAENNNIIDFIEKPNPIPEYYIQNNQCRVNMGIYWFNRDILFQTLLKDEQNTQSSNDFGHDVLPLLINDVATNMIDVAASHPWQDVGTIERYWQSHWTYQSHLPNWDIQPTIEGSSLTTGYTGSPFPDSTNIDRCIIFKNVTIGEHCSFRDVIIESGCVIDNHITLTLNTPIEGTIYKTTECIVIPKNSVVKYDQKRNMVTVEQR